MNINRRKQIVVLVILVVAAIAVSGIIFYVSMNQENLITVSISEDGFLSAEMPAFDSGRRIYRLFWETDAGSLDSSYFAYSETYEKVKWSPDDADGNRYIYATIKVHLYEERPLYIIDISEYEVLASAAVTVKYDVSTGKYSLLENTRVFGNPVREDGNTDWAEIYRLYESTEPDSEYIVLRYRTGHQLNASNTIYWESNAAPISRVSFSGVPPYTPTDAPSNRRIIRNTDTLSFITARFENLFFTNENPIDDYGRTIIKISAFVVVNEVDSYSAAYEFAIE